MAEWENGWSSDPKVQETDFLWLVQRCSHWLLLPILKAVWYVLFSDIVISLLENQTEKQDHTPVIGSSGEILHRGEISDYLLEMSL